MGDLDGIGFGVFWLMETIEAGTAPALYRPQC